MAVLAKWLGKMRCETEVMGTRHVVIGDEPVHLGGDDAGPNPFAFLEMSLAN